MTRTMISWIAMALLAGVAGAQGTAEEGSHAVTFEAPIGEGSPVTLSFEGKVYGAGGWWLDGLDDGQLDAAERFVRRVVDTNRDGDVESTLR